MSRFNYLDMLRIRRKAGKVETLSAESLSEQQRVWRDEGVCIECGRHPQAEKSLICSACAALVSMEDIRKDLESIRQKILGAAHSEE